MRSMRDLVHDEDLGAPPISFLALCRNHGVKTLKALAASHDITQRHRETGGDYGPLGSPLGSPHEQSPGIYTRDYQLGFITTQDDGLCKAFSSYKVRANIAAVHCIGTDDPSGTDEPFLIASLYAVNPNLRGDEDLVVTRMVGPAVVQAGGVFGDNHPIGEVSPSGGGVKIHLALWDKENGDEETLKEEVEEFIREAVKEGTVAIATALGAGDINAAGAAGEILNSKIGRTITLGISNAIADVFADDFLGEKIYSINNADIVNWYPQAPTHTDAALPPGVQFTLPFEHLNPHWLFSLEGATYRVYVQIIVDKTMGGCERPH